ncbi:hypothetical protein BDR05DRAFT_976854 [Suillus weaverae]|nr:hypothetical protein BDR05DRAFT_976854 [Suillus weaverae]
MGYLWEENQCLFDTLRANGGVVDVFNDFCKGHEFLDAVQRGDIKPNDVVLMISLDGVQLYESKLSDCWIYIWKQYVLPGGFIPGPNKPKNVDSFLFPGMHYLAALQNEGLHIWDAWCDVIFISNPFLIFVTADGPGLVYFDGMVGHSGKNGCRLYCGLLSHWKGTHYYPALLIPHRYTLSGSNHPDISVYELHDPKLTEYFNNLLKLYRKLQTQTGITKPSLLLGLHPLYTLGIPNCLTPDIMHLAQLLSNLLLSLWCDHVSTWPWAIFHNVDTWETHGEAVNPTEKINSGYKTWEYQIYIFGLGPALLYDILSHPYWLNYCRLVRGFHCKDA